MQEKKKSNILDAKKEIISPFVECIFVKNFKISICHFRDLLGKWVFCIKEDKFTSTRSARSETFPGIIFPNP